MGRISAKGRAEPPGRRGMKKLDGCACYTFGVFAPAYPTARAARRRPLRRDPPRCLLHAFRDQGGHAVVVMTARCPLWRGTPSLMPGDHPLHGLVRGPPRSSGPAESACLTVGGDDAHSFPRRLG